MNVSRPAKSSSKSTVVKAACFIGAMALVDYYMSSANTHDHGHNDSHHHHHDHHHNSGFLANIAAQFADVAATALTVTVAGVTAAVRGGASVASDNNGAVMAATEVARRFFTENGYNIVARGLFAGGAALAVNKAVEAVIGHDEKPVGIMKKKM